MKIMFVAQDKGMASAINEIIGQLIQENHEFLAILCSSEIPRPESIMDFEPDFLVMELPKNPESNEAELLMHAKGDRIPLLCWTIEQNSGNIDETLKRLQLEKEGVSIQIFDCKERFFDLTFSFLLLPK